MQQETQPRRISAYEMGNEFENRVYDYIYTLLRSMRMPGVSTFHRLFKHRGYIDRNGRRIVTDVSIENYADSRAMEAAEWSTLIIIECKASLKPALNIGKLDEFEGKLSKIAAYGVKGYLACDCPLTESAVSQARAMHIGIILFDRERRWNWIAPCSSGDAAAQPVAIVDGEAMSVAEALRRDGIPLPHAENLRFDEEIRRAARSLAAHYSDSDRYNLPYTIVRVLMPDWRLVYAPLPDGVEAASDFISRRITLHERFRVSRRDGARALAHEIGHLLFHRRVFEYVIPASTNEMLEHQANLFATELLR